MARVWVCAARTCVEADEHGRLISYHPGDWFQVHRLRAIEMIELGNAEIPGTDSEREIVTGELDDCCVLMRGGTRALAREQARKWSIAVLPASDGPGLPAWSELYQRVLFWQPRLPLTRSQALLGFTHVEERAGYDNWELAAMLRSNELMASQIGPQAEKDKTLAAVGDLRLPVYETQAVWVRRTAATEALIAAWADELEAGAHEEHAFLRALYTHRVAIETLPFGWLVSWLKRGG